jgi:hypothetical protein
LNAVGSVSYLASNLCQGIIVTFRYTHALIDQQWKRKKIQIFCRRLWEALSKSLNQELHWEINQFCHIWESDLQSSTCRSSDLMISHVSKIASAYILEQHSA